MASDLDDLTSALSASFSVSHHEGATTARNHPAYSHDRTQQYKNKGDRTTEAGQNHRRRRLLDEQKKRREALLEIKRKSKLQDEEDDEGDEDEIDYDKEFKDSASKAQHSHRPIDKYLHQHYHSYPATEGGDEQMDYNEIARKPRRRRPDQIWNTYKDTLMFSEWLVEIPEDMESEWLVLPIPVGKRSLLVASHSTTNSFSKGGMLLNSFGSQLPNGSSGRRHEPQYLLFDARHAGETMVDCIFSARFFAYFALDLLMWRDYDVRDCDTEFRMWFLESKLAEIPTSRNQKKSQQNIIRIPCYPCNGEGIRQCFSWQPFPNETLELDGLMFYHKKTAYTTGETPLVGWLKPFMVPEVLGISIPAWIHKPSEYSDFRSHISAFNEEEAKKRAKHLERVEKRKQKQEEHVAMELAKTIEPRSSRGSKKSSDSQDEIFGQLAKSKSEDKTGWINETLEESLQRTKEKNAEGSAAGGILEELNLDETASFTNAESKMEYFLERKMALDTIQDRGLKTLNAVQDEQQMAMDAAEVEREIEEIKRSEAGIATANLPLEKLLTSLATPDDDDVASPAVGAGDEDLMGRSAADGEEEEEEDGGY